MYPVSSFAVILPLRACELLQTSSGFQFCYSPKHLASRHYLYSDMSAFSFGLGLQLCKKRKEKKNYVGSDTTSYIY